MADSDEITAAKAQLRATAKERRAALTPEVRKGAALALAAHGLGFLPRPPPAGAIIGGFMPIGEEISPLPLMAQLRTRGYRLALPVMMGKNKPLEFRAYTGRSLFHPADSIEPPDPPGDP